MRVLLALLSLASCKQSLSVLSPKSGSRLTPLYIRAGGDTIRAGMYDRVLGERCYPLNLGGRYFCGPPASRCSRNYAAEGCSQRIGDAAGHGAYCYDEAKAACSAPSFFRFGDRVALDDAHCAIDPSAFSGAVDLRTLTPISLAQFVEVSLRRSGGEGRLQPYYFVGADGSAVAASRYFDTELALDCAFVSIEPGARHCLPVNLVTGYAQPVYADEGCTEPVIGASSCNGAKADAWLGHFETFCGGIDLHALGETVSSAYGGNGFGFGCSRLTVPSNVTLYRLDKDALAPRLAKVQPRIASDARIVVRRDQDDFGLFDTRLSIPCQPGIDDHGKMRCLPLTPAMFGMATYYSDPDCRTQLFTPRGDVGLDAALCEEAQPTYVLSTRGPLKLRAATPSATYTFNFDKCVPLTSDASAWFEGDPVGFDQFGDELEEVGLQ